MEDPTLAEIWKVSKKHFEDDLNFQNKVSKQFERMEPMIKAFENRRIIKMAFESESNTLYIYSKRALTIGALVAGIWGIVKFITKL